MSDSVEEGAAAGDSEGNSLSDVAPALGDSGSESDGSADWDDDEGDAGFFTQEPYNGEPLQPQAAAFEQRRLLRLRTLHVVQCSNDACEKPMCAPYRRAIAHHTAECRGASCTASPPGHWRSMRILALAHAPDCSESFSHDGDWTCCWPNCDAAQQFLRLLKQGLEPLCFELEDITDPPDCRHPAKAFGSLPFDPIGPHREAIHHAVRIRLPGQPRSTGVPLLGFLEGRDAMPGLSRALPADIAKGIESYQGRIFDVYGWYSLLPLRIGMLIDAGAFHYTVRFLYHDFFAVVKSCIANRAACLHAMLRQFAFAVKRVQEKANESGDAAAAQCTAELQRAEVMDFLALFVGMHSLEQDAAAAIIAVMRAAERAGGALPVTEAARVGLFVEWLMPALAAQGGVPTEMPMPEAVESGCLGEFMWQNDHTYESYSGQDHFHLRGLALFEALSLLATTPAARALALSSKAFMPIFNMICQDFSTGCRRNRCTDMAVGGAALRQMCYAPEALQDDVLLARIRDVLTVSEDNLQRWVIVYAIFPMARAERKARASNAEEAQLAACCQHCCDSAISAPDTLAALDRAGITHLLCFVLDTRPVGRRSACLALSLLLGRDAAQLLPQLACSTVLCSSASAAAARAQDAAAAAARRTASQALRRRNAKAAALKERQESTDGKLKECLTPGDGCESDCEGASDDDDANGESAPLCASLLATLNCATAGMPPPPLPAHGIAAEAAVGSAAGVSVRPSASARRKNKGAAAAAAGAPDAAAVAAAEAAAAALLAEEEEEAAKASRAASRKSSKKSKAAKQKQKAAQQKQPQQSAAADEASEDDASEPPAAEAARTDDAPAEQAAPLPAAAAPAQHAAAACRDGCCAPAAPFCLGVQRQRAAPPAREAEAAPAAAAHAAAPAGAEPESGVSAEELIAELFPHLRLRDDTAGPAPAAAAAPPAEPDDDELCVCCMDAPRDTALRACADKHAPVLCAACAASVLVQGSKVCPWCSTPVLPT